MSKKASKNAKKLKGGKRDQSVDKIKLSLSEKDKTKKHRKRNSPKKKAYKPKYKIIAPKITYSAFVQKSSLVTLKKEDGAIFKIGFTSQKTVQKIQEGKVNLIFIGCPLSKALVGKKEGDFCSISEEVKYKIIKIIKPFMVQDE